MLFRSLRVFLSTPPSRVATCRHPPDAPHGRKFLSTPPSRVATNSVTFPIWVVLRFYPRHPRGWRHIRCSLSGGRNGVSIHATLAGGDGLRSHNKKRKPLVSIHATLAGGDATFFVLLCCGGCFYPRHPRGWRLYKSDLQKLDMPVSIHATLAGGDFDIVYNSA